MQLIVCWIQLSLNKLQEMNMGKLNFVLLPLKLFIEIAKLITNTVYNN